jgi:hypothetical protein
LQQALGLRHRGVQQFALQLGYLVLGHHNSSFGPSLSAMALNTPPAMALNSLSR